MNQLAQPTVRYNMFITCLLHVYKNRVRLKMRASCDESTSSQVKVSHGGMFMPTAEPHTVNVNRAIKRRAECFLSARHHLSEAVSEVASSAAAGEGLAVRSCVCAGSAGPPRSRLTSLKHPETKAAAASHHEHANGNTGVCGD